MAFPNTGNSTWNLEPTPGMSLRDYFAGQLVGEATRLFHTADGQQGRTNEELAGGVAALCYLVADALLAARKAPAA